jgi:PilZ domain
MKAEERRKYPRLRREEQVVIRRVDDPDEDPAHTALYCKTVDVSPTGMQVRLKKGLEHGEHVDVVIQVEGYGNSFHLCGEIKWCRELAGEEMCLAGIEIVDAEHSDLVRWKRVFN